MNKINKQFFEQKKRELGVELNEVQKQAVTMITGPLLLLASPGSGKTTTIIMRIGYMLEVLNIAPNRIKAVTFSKASAADMKERFTKFFPYLQPVEFSTIHSLAYGIVRQGFHLLGYSYEILKESDKIGSPSKKQLLRDLYEKHNKTKITEDQLEELMTYISFVKNKMLPEHLWDDETVKIPNKVQIFKAYERSKQLTETHFYIDYDDMLLIANDLLVKYPQLRHHYQQNFDYVLTDESQDTSPVQHAIIEKLVEHHQNLCVVADEDQSIYSWRGADPSYLLAFKEHYKRAEILYMTQNYRSTQSIVVAANQFILRNKERYPKNMVTDNELGEPIQFTTLRNFQQQAEYVIGKVKASVNDGTNAIIFRNNNSAIPLMDELQRSGISFYMKDASLRFFKHWVVEDILNFMRLAFNTSNMNIFEKVAGKINAYITPRQMKELAHQKGQGCVFTQLLENVPLQDYQPQYIKNAKKVYDRIQFHKTPPTEMLQLIRQELGYEKSLERLSEKFGFRYDSLIDVLEMLALIAKHTKTMTDFANRLKQLEELAQNSFNSKNQANLTLTTMHSAKGLEFDYVYMIDLIDGVLPTGVEREEEEDARLFYVGITRAIRSLELITYERRFTVKSLPSKFYSELYKIVDPSIIPKRKTTQVVKPIIQKYSNEQTIKHANEIEIGMEINHVMFGIGKVLNITNSIIELETTKGIKKFQISTCIQQGYLEKLK